MTQWEFGLQYYYCNGGPVLIFCRAHHPFLRLMIPNVSSPLEMGEKKPSLHYEDDAAPNRSSPGKGCLAVQNEIP